MFVGLNRQVDQEMRSAFLVIDVIGRNAGVEIECHPRGIIDPELENGKEAVRLVR
jgi:hypothetical protein